MRIAVLGPLAMWAADGSPLDVRGVRLRGLLARLALDAGRPVSVDTLVDGLWGSEAPSANALQSLVSRLRAVLPPTESSISVLSGPAGYTLTIAPDCVDALQFEDLVRRARAATPTQARALLTQAERLWRGDALADLRHLPFATVEADRLTELRVGAAEDLAETTLADGQAREAIPDLERLTSTHPLRERLHELLIRALYADGRQAEALAAYERARNVLADELGADPGTRLRELHTAVLHGSPIDPTSAPATATAAATRQAKPRGGHNLRAPLTSFVGRADDVAELTRILNDGTRLVTMVGPGGAGKTRLATETGRALAEQGGDGIWFVELAPLGAAADVAPAVLTALGASEYVDNLQTTLAPKHFPTSRAATDRLVEVIADRQVLLVLDNCEHLVDEVAGLVDSLLAACAQLKVLTTSREPLAIPGEHLHQVGPLTLPPSNSPSDDAAAKIPGAAAAARVPGAATVPSDDYPAVRLFVDRARAVRPDFSITEANRESVAEICRRLDGMPLAIELAAARLRALTPPQIVERLADRFRLLTTGSRTALPRHQTLRAVVEWSWDLLDPDEQAVARRLSYFSGGASLEAAERVCSGPGLPPEAVLGVLASLVDKSLIEAVAGDRSVRYRMLETVKAYGAEQLAASGERDDVRQAHTEFFAELVSGAGENLRSHAQLQWIARFDEDNENLLAALRAAVDTQDASTALEVVTGLGEYWNMRGRPAEALSWFEAALAVSGPAKPLTRATTWLMYAVGTLMTGEESPGSFARALRGLATVRLFCRRHPEVAESATGRYANIVWWGLRRDKPAYLRELDAVKADPDLWIRSIAVMMQAMFNENEGQVEQTVADLQDALRGFREVGDRWGTSMALRGLAAYYSAAGDHSAALATVTEALQLTGELGTTEGITHLLAQAALSRSELGDNEGAAAELQRGLQQAQETGSRSGEGLALLGLCALARRTGRLDEAAELGERAFDHLDPENERIAPHGKALVLTQLARLAVAQGDLAKAQEYSSTCVECALTTEDMPITSAAVEAAADVSLFAGDPECAARLLGITAVLRGMRSVPDSDVRRTVAALQDALGPDRYRAVYDEGAGLSREDAFAELRKRFSSS